jgi:hypothetical protein
LASSREAFEKGGGKVVKELPNSRQVQPFDRIASIKPDAVYVFFGAAPW